MIYGCGCKLRYRVELGVKETWIAIKDWLVYRHFSFGDSMFFFLLFGIRKYVSLDDNMPFLVFVIFFCYDFIIISYKSILPMSSTIPKYFTDLESCFHCRILEHLTYTIKD